MLSGTLDIALWAVEKARSLGAEQAEGYISFGRELVVEVRDGKVETLKTAREQGLGLRVIAGRRVGFAYTSDLRREVVEELAARAVSNAASTSPDPCNRLPAPVPEYPVLDLYDRAILAATVEEKIEMARALEKSAREYDRRVRAVETAAYHDGEVEVGLVNSLGIKASYRGAYCGLYISLVAEEDGEAQTGFAVDYTLKFALLDPVKVGREAAQKAVRMLGARSLAAQRVPVVLEPYVAAGFLGLLGPALTAEAVQKKRSLFAGRVGQEVASPQVTVVDDGAMEGGLASAPFDGEGVPTGRTVLIEGGILQGFLHNTYTAAKEGVSSTGNGVRGSFKATPEVGTTNFFIRPGASSPEELIRNTPRGLYVTEVLGMHTANPISGDFSVGATGILIENGELTRPVRGITIAGNILDLLKNIDGVGNDLKFFGGKGSPTIRVAGVSVSG